jgi:hypothetical protein
MPKGEYIDKKGSQGNPTSALDIHSADISSDHRWFIDRTIKILIKMTIKILIKMTIKILIKMYDESY